MAWISVHETVYGPKLRNLAKSIHCTEDEAEGILTRLWFWGQKNADKFGRLLYADRKDIVLCLSAGGEINSVLKEAIRAMERMDLLGGHTARETIYQLVNAGVVCDDYWQVVDALVETGWIDETEEGIFIHDWAVWQEQWYKAQEKRAYLAQKKREERERRKSEDDQTPESDKAQPPKKPVDKKEPPKKPEAPEPEKKPKGPPKKKYAEFVQMTEVEYGKLVSEYGEDFTKECVRTLDNYKGANGKRYKDDYRAILNWVVERVSKNNPQLLKRSKAKQVPQTDENPFAIYAEGD